MKSTFLAASIALACAGQAWAGTSDSEFLINDIRINGLQRVSAGSVFAALPLNVGERLDSQRLVEATNSLFKTGFFQDIQLARDNDVLIVNLLERPSIANIKISGNRVINTDDLLKGLKNSGLAEGEIFQRATLEGIRNELQRQYVAQGRYSAHIEVAVEQLPRNRVEIKIEISEGKIASIRHINFVGNQVYDNELLRDIFALKERHWLSFFKGDDKYSREKLAGDLERIRSYYLDRGYINMGVSATQVSITPDKKHIYITVNVNEGEQYRIREVKLAGELKVDERELQELLLTEEGQIFSRQVMNASADLLARRLGNDGYTFADVVGVPQVHDEDNTVTLTFMVNPGKRAYVNRINFSGNSKTKDEVLRREMRQMEGGWASTYLIDQSKTRLDRLGYFSEVNVETPLVPGTDDQVDVNISVVEQPSGAITASVGYAQYAGLILGGSISQSNFMGTGNYASLSLNRSEYQSYYSFNFTDPYWTVDGVSLGYNGYYRETNYDKLNVDFSSYSVDSYGAGVTMGYPISEESRLSFGLSIQNDRIKPMRWVVEEIEDFVAREGNTNQVYKGRFGWSQNTLNRGTLPTRGGSQSVDFSVTLPGSDVKYYNIDYSGQLYKGLFGDHALRFHTRLGYGDGIGSKSLPFYENYYAGGFGSVRGFRDNSLGPRSTPHSTDPDKERYPFGGNLLVQGGVEWIFPMPFIKEQRSLRSYAFWDIGSVFNTSCSRQQKNENDPCSFAVDELAQSAGIGITWVTAVGPLNFSFARPLKEPTNYKKQFFQFTMGHTF